MTSGEINYLIESNPIDIDHNFSPKASSAGMFVVFVCVSVSSYGWLFCNVCSTQPLHAVTLMQRTALSCNVNTHSLIDVVALTDGDSTPDALLMMGVFTQVFQNDVGAHAQAHQDQLALWVEVLHFLSHDVELLPTSWYHKLMGQLCEMRLDCVIFIFDFYFF